LIAERWLAKKKKTVKKTAAKRTPKKVSRKRAAPTTKKKTTAPKKKVAKKKTRPKPKISKRDKSAMTRAADEIVSGLMRIGANNGRLKTGNPGNKGGGRLPEEYREKFREILNDPDVQVQVLAILRNRNHDHFPAIYKLIVEQAIGKPKEVIEGDIVHRVGIIALPAKGSMRELGAPIEVPPEVQAYQLKHGDHATD